MTVFKRKELTRRKFLKYSSSMALGTPFLSPLLNRKSNTGSSEITCRDVTDHFKETGKWVDWDNTVDTFKAGDPSRPVRKIAVAWKASFDAIRQAVSRGADMLISHESICVKGNGSPKPEVNFALPSEKPKFDFLEKTGLVVFRCHDFWDRFPQIGIRDTWRREIEIGDKIVADEYPFYVTEVTPVSVQELAGHILKKIQPLGQNGIIACGNLMKKVSKIGTGTGAIVDPFGLRDTGAEVGIISDDYYVHVRMGVHANELDFPVILVNHGVSEEWGIMNLTRYVQRTFPLIEVFHIPQYCPYKIIVS